MSSTWTMGIFTTREEMETTKVETPENPRKKSHFDIWFHDVGSGRIPCHTVTNDYNDLFFYAAFLLDAWMISHDA